MDGVDYNFITRMRFESMIAEHAFLEWADVFGNLYGTGRADAESLMASGKDVVLVIDVQGAGQVRATGISLVTVFVLPPSFKELKARLELRAEDSPEVIAKRLANARIEMERWVEYDYVIVNDDLERCVSDVAAIIRAERLRRARRSGVIEPIIGTFRSEGT